MLTSTNLCVIPFLGHCDNARLQMSAKQLAQSLTHLNCEVPKLFGHDYHYLSDSTRMFKYTTPFNGEVIYENNEIMIVNMKMSEDNYYIDIFETPQYMNTSSLHASQLRYKRPIGPFSIGDVLYEYDCFHNNIPTYGYNIWTAYMSWFGLNHEDSICLSEWALNKMHSMKTEQILIPIYDYSVFRHIYPESSFKFLPDIGQPIQENIVTYRNSIRPGNNILSQMKNLSLSEFTSITNDDHLFNSIPITCRIPNAIVLDIRIHTINSNLKLIDKNLEVYINRMKQIYEPKLKEIVTSLRSLFPKSFSDSILSSQYVMINKLKNDLIDRNQIAYLIELKVGKDDSSHLGDKFANRYANKGVCSKIIPNELRPIITRTGQPIDYISGPITGVGRMNFGQFIEGCISKSVDNSERIIKKDNSKAPSEIRKLANISRILKDFEYAEKIDNLANQMENDESILKQFISSVNENGLYMEAPGFVNCELKELEDVIYKDSQIKVEEEIYLSKDLIEFINDALKITGLPSAPSEGVYLPNIYCAPIYTLKLKQESYYRSSARDFGSYKSTNYQPVQGRSSDGFIGASARLGQMEFDALLGHNVLRTMKELRTVKNDSKELKTDMTQQIITKGYYELPETKSITNFTKTIIESYMEFLND